jgi:histidinol-phosphate aminotransferase
MNWMNIRIITQTLSKAYGLAGIRLGVCYASSQIIAILNKIKPPYNVNEPKKSLRLADIEKIQMEIDSIIIQEKIYLKYYLMLNSFLIYPTEANFINQSR